MCPACVVGILFAAQLFAVARWFRRVVLKKPLEDDADYWTPGISMLSPKMQAFARDKRRVTATVLVLAAEIALVVVIYHTVGFGYIRSFLAMLGWT